MKFKNYISKIGFLIILTFFLLSKLIGQNAKRDNIYKYEDPGSFIDGSDITYSPYMVKSFKKAKNIPLPKHLKKFKGRIFVYIKFKSNNKIKRIYITKVNLSDGKKHFAYSLGISSHRKKYMGKKINYPSDIKKMLPYVKKYVYSLGNFYLVYPDKPALTYWYFSIRIPN